MFIDTYEYLLGEPLPEWAVARTDGELVIGAQMCTRDGRRIGNGLIVNIVDVSYEEQDVSYTAYIIETDMKNTVSLTKSEVEEFFYPPRFICDVEARDKDIIEKINYKSCPS